MEKPTLFFIFALSLLVLSVSALAWEARVVDVADGDTITVEPIQGGNRVKIRLHGIDAPETKQSYGQAAKGFVNNVALYKVVDVQPTPQGSDRYGRIVAVVVIPGIGILQELLLERGLAWVYPRYCKNCTNWEAIQTQAQSQQRGLWTDKDPIPPWEWRKR